MQFRTMLKNVSFYYVLLLNKKTLQIFSSIPLQTILSYNHFIFWRPLNWICVEIKTLALPSTCYCFRLSIGLRFKLNQSTKTRLMPIHFLIFRYRRSVCFFPQELIRYPYNLQLILWLRKVIKKRMQTIDTLFCREMFLCHCFFIHCWTTSRIGIVRKNAWFSAFQKTLGIR